MTSLLCRWGISLSKYGWARRVRESSQSSSVSWRRFHSVRWRPGCGEEGAWGPHTFQISCLVSVNGSWWRVGGTESSCSGPRRTRCGLQWRLFFFSFSFFFGVYEQWDLVAWTRNCDFNVEIDTLQGHWISIGFKSLSVFEDCWAHW